MTKDVASPGDQFQARSESLKEDADRKIYRAIHCKSQTSRDWCYLMEMRKKKIGPLIENAQKHGSLLLTGSDGPA